MIRSKLVLKYSHQPPRILSDTTLHLNPGDKLTAHRFQKSHDGRRNCGVWVTRDSDGKEFQIFTDDLKRYIKIV